jgi:hypothetical protein
VSCGVLVDMAKKARERSPIKKNICEIREKGPRATREILLLIMSTIFYEE